MTSAPASRIDATAEQPPQGLTVWPQPARYLRGHTGNMR